MPLNKNFNQIQLRYRLYKANILNLQKKKKDWAEKDFRVIDINKFTELKETTINEINMAQW